MPNLDPWINQSEKDQQQQQQQQRINTPVTAATAAETSKLENHLLSVRDQNQKEIKPNCHPTYNEDHEKRIEIIEWVLKKYKDGLSKKIINNKMKNK